jgi:pimeloyl-ACP methyl ester carboxylesterase
MGEKAMKTKNKVINVELHEALSLFRNQFALKSLMYQQTEWNYYAGGSGNDTIIILPGGLGTGEAAFLYLLELGKNHKVISPVYPHLDSMDELSEGIKEIIDNEKAENITLFGVSFGGLLAQCFMKKFADKVTNLILAHTATNITGYENDDIHKTVDNLHRGIDVLRKLPAFMIRFMLKRKYRKLAQRMGDEAWFWKHYLKDIAGRSTKESVLSSLESMLNF